MRFFDGHCDTASEILNKNQGLLKNNLHIDGKRLEKFEDFTQVFAAFISPEHYGRAMERCKEIVENFKNELEKCGIPLWKQGEIPKGSQRAILSLEGGEPIDSLESLDTLAGWGIRMIAPTWNHKNQLGCGVMEETDTGLTDLGKRVLSKMGKMGIILDVSHLSEKSFWDATKVYDGIICASHSNLKSVVNHPRNLSRDQFMEIKSRRGVCGINLYPPFFGEDISCIKAHIDAILALGGEDNIGLGCDFDGVDFLPDGVCGVESLEKIIKNLPYSTEIKEKIAYKNFLRVFL